MSAIWIEKMNGEAMEPTRTSMDIGPESWSSCILLMLACTLAIPAATRAATRAQLLLTGIRFHSAGVQDLLMGSGLLYSHAGFGQLADLPRW